MSANRTGDELVLQNATSCTQVKVETGIDRTVRVYRYSPGVVALQVRALRGKTQRIVCTARLSLGELATLRDHLSELLGEAKLSGKVSGAAARAAAAWFRSTAVHATGNDTSEDALAERIQAAIDVAVAMAVDAAVRQAIAKNNALADADIRRVVAEGELEIAALREALEACAEFWANGTPVHAGSEVAQDVIALLGKAAR